VVFNRMGGSPYAPSNWLQVSRPFVDTDAAVSILWKDCYGKTLTTVSRCFTHNPFCATGSIAAVIET
jgi:hypothetical protein